MSAALVGLFLVVALVAPLLLYYLVRAEHDERETMDRRSAERSARQDTSEGEGEDPTGGS